MVFLNPSQVAGGRNRGYTVIIENGSDKEVCGVTFMPNAVCYPLLYVIHAVKLPKLSFILTDS